MSPDSTFQQDPSFLARPLAALTRLTLRAPWLWLGLAAALAVASIFLFISTLELRTSRLDLLNPRSGYNQLWIDFIRDFGEDDDAVVVVDGPDRASVVTAIDAIAAELKLRDRHFRDVLWKIETRGLREKGLYYLDPQQLQSLDRFLAQLQPVLGGDWSQVQVGRLLSGLSEAASSADPATRAAATASLKRHAENLTSALQQQQQYESPWALPGLEASSPVKSESYFLEDDDRLGLLLLHLNVEEGSFDRGGKAIDQLREILADMQTRFPQVQIGLTGLPVMENDEMRASERATLKASGISLIGVTLLFIAGFGGLRRPLLAVAALLVGLAWSVGYLSLTIGHLNILSMAFGIILIGLGIDFGIHFLARYQVIRAESVACDEALVEAVAQVGPGIVTGGVTTALAFFAAGLTKFTGVAELGIIAGGGVLLCVVAAIVVLPLLLFVNDRTTAARSGIRVLAVDRWFCLSYYLPRSTIALGVAGTALLAVAISSVTYDHNLLNLQPVGLESVALEEMLLERSEQSVWYALSIANSPEELLERKRKFEQLAAVERTEEIVSLLPESVTGKEDLISAIRQRLADSDTSEAVIPVDPPVEMGEVLRRVYLVLDGDVQTQETSLRLKSAMAQSLAASEGRSTYFAALNQYQQQLMADLLARMQQLRRAAAPDAPALDDLPAGLVNRFVGQSGRHLLKVYSNADIWDMDELKEFVVQVRQVDPRATGKPLQTYEASRQMQESYIHAALYALIGVTILLVFDFQSLRFALLALVPVGLGMLQLFGLMGWLGIPLNPANMIVLPLILGIGLDDGVHVLHDFRSRPGRYRLSSSTATAIMLTSLTTMVGFGSMMIADHRGLQSLGRVLTIGVVCCLASSLVILPAILCWFTRKKPAATPAQQSDWHEDPLDPPVFRLSDSTEVATSKRDPSI